MKFTKIGSTGEYESGVVYMLLNRYDENSNDLYPNKEAVEAAIDNDDVLQGDKHGCGHSYDCCGCVRSSSADIIGYDEMRDQYILAQSWHRNI